MTKFQFYFYIWLTLKFDPRAISVSATYVIFWILADKFTKQFINLFVFLRFKITCTGVTNWFLRQSVQYLWSFRAPYKFCNQRNIKLLLWYLNTYTYPIYVTTYHITRTKQSQPYQIMPTKLASPLINIIPIRSSSIDYFNHIIQVMDVGKNSCIKRVLQIRGINSVRHLLRMDKDTLKVLEYK